MMVPRLRFICATGNPLSPSLAPSSRTRTFGLCRHSAAAMRAAPPLEVSPLTLAFATV
jgi:hypothetical protein